VLNICFVAEQVFKYLGYGKHFKNVHTFKIKGIKAQVYNCRLELLILAVVKGVLKLARAMSAFLFEEFRGVCVWFWVFFCFFF